MALSFMIASALSAFENIHILSLPTEKWMEYRNLRLQALKDCPQAFGISVSDEQDRSAQEWQDAYIGNGKWFVFAQCDGKLIGMLGAEVPFGSHMQHIVEIVRAYVDPKFRRQGVFRQLFLSLKERLEKEKQLEEMIVWTTRYGHPENWVENAYKKLGFEFCGVLPNVVKIEKQCYDCSWLTTSLKK